MTIQYTHT